MNPHLLATATVAARAAGDIIARSSGRALHVDDAPAHDLKLALDRLCEAEILRVIRAAFPDHAILSEETGYIPGRASFLWIVDPLDGTVNFYHGIPFFCTSIACYALREEATGHRFPDGRTLGDPLVGVVYNPLREEMFVGAAGEGASLNHVPLAAPTASRLDQAVVALSFGAREESIACMSRLLPDLVRSTRKIRSFGSTALDIVQVAAGRVGAFVQMGTNLWDFAAAAVVAREAGAVVDAQEYRRGRWKIVASAAGIYDAIRAKVGHE